MRFKLARTLGVPRVPVISQSPPKLKPQFFCLGSNLHFSSTKKPSRFSMGRSVLGAGDQVLYRPLRPWGVIIYVSVITRGPIGKPRTCFHHNATRLLLRRWSRSRIRKLGRGLYSSLRLNTVLRAAFNIGPAAAIAACQGEIR